MFFVRATWFSSWAVDCTFDYQFCVKPCVQKRIIKRDINLEENTRFLLDTHTREPVNRLQSPTVDAPYMQWLKWLRFK